MVTQCPMCRRWFRVESGETEAAHGLVRCGECATVFNALATLCERVPPVRKRESPDRVPADAGVRAAGDKETADASDAEMALAPLLETRAEPRRPAHWLWGVAAALAALALAAQLVHAGRYAIARVPVAGPALAAVYRTFGASLDDRLVLNRYEIAGAALAGAPDSGRALVLDGSLINRASYAQRLPLIRLRLSDSRGNVLGSRMLLPSDYGAITMSTLAAMHALHFHVKLADPGVRAVGFTLVLCKRQGGRVVCRQS